MGGFADFASLMGGASLMGLMGLLGLVWLLGLLGGASLMVGGFAGGTLRRWGNWGWWGYWGLWGLWGASLVGRVIIIAGSRPAGGSGACRVAAMASLMLRAASVFNLVIAVEQCLCSALGGVVCCKVASPCA